MNSTSILLVQTFAVFLLFVNIHGQDATFRWRNSLQSSGSSCGLMKPELNYHVNDALLDLFLYSWKGVNNSTVPEICDNYLRLTASSFLESNLNNIWLSPRSSNEVHLLQSYYRLMNIDSPIKAVGALPAMIDYQDASRGATQRGYFEQVVAPILSSGPSYTELADATYRLLIQNGWSYMVIMTEAEDGAARFSQALVDFSKIDQRACFSLIITFTASNASQAAKSLREFAYPKMTRLTVVYAGSGSTFLALWDFVTGSDLTYTDSDKKYQFVVVGDAFGSFHRATNTNRRRNFGAGTVFVFPRILDPNPLTDPVANLLFNITSNPESMGAFSSLTDTWMRLLALKNSTSSSCSWSSYTDLCYQQALMYDYSLLSFLPLITVSSGIFDRGPAYLRTMSMNLSHVATRFSFVNSFLLQNYTTYTLANGLNHRTRGFWQPIVKVYQSQINSGSQVLVKLGELRILQAGTSNQSYEWEMSGTPVFYKFEGSAENLPTSATTYNSVCPGNCPECAQTTGKQYIEYKPGDIYIGALLPIFNRGSDVYQCTDGSLYAVAPEWAMAYRVVVSLVNWVSQSSSALPTGLDPSLIDEQFMLGIKDLLSKVQEGRTNKLNLGYVILDSCYAAPTLTYRLGLLMAGKLDPLIGVNFSKFVGFIGDSSSTQTMAASQILKQYSLPIISFASTSTALSDVVQFPFTMRTVASDNEIVEAMITIIKHYKVDILTVAYTTNAYGVSLKNAMVEKTTRNNICITKLLVLDCSATDNICKHNLALEMRASGSRYVAFLCDMTDLASFLNFPQVETDLEFITILAAEDVSSSLFTGKNNLGIGTTMVELVSSPEPAILRYLNYTLTRIPTNSNNLSQWDKIYFENYNQCYLPDSFVRSITYSQACTPSIVASRMLNQLDSRTALVKAATETLILGTLTAIKYICSVVTPDPVCPAFFKGTADSQSQRANLIMYGQVTATGTTAQKFSGSFGVTLWSFQKIFENRMGRTPMRLLQFRKKGSAEYDFVQFGMFDGVNSSTFTATPDQLYAFERQLTSSLVKSCRTKAECGNPKCVNDPNLTNTISPCNELMGLYGLLILPGILIGLIIFWILRRLIGVPNKEPDYATPDNNYSLPERPQRENGLPMNEGSASPANFEPFEPTRQPPSHSYVVA